MKTIQQLVLKHIETLQHFIEEGAYPLRVIQPEETTECLYMDKNEANELMRFTGLALRKRGDMLCKRGDFSTDILATYYKLRLEEEQAESERLYGLIQDFTRKV